MLAYSYAFCALALVCSRARLVSVLCALASLPPRVLTCLRCLLVLCPYVLICLTCLLSPSILCAYVLACLLSLFAPLALHLKSYILKVLIQENLLLFREVFRIHLSIYVGVFYEKIDFYKLLIVLVKRLDHRSSTGFYIHFIFIDTNSKTYILKPT